MERSVWVAQRSVAVIVTAAAVSAFIWSYAALHGWAVTHGEDGGWAWGWPLQVDCFIAVGELILFIATVYAWSWKRKTFAWSVTLTGLAVSIAGNAGLGDSLTWTERLTHAVPPLTATVILTIGIYALKWIVTDQAETTEATPAYQPRHSDRLEAMATASLRIRYALEITGSHTPRELAEWLEQHGHPVSVENVRTVLRRTSSNGDSHAALPISLPEG